MLTKEITCKSLLNESGIADYCVNPYVGCQHACAYCYADSITRRFSRHTEPWGTFVDVKTNAAEVMAKEVDLRKKGQVFVSSLTDAYQPMERKYDMTRKLLPMLLEKGFGVSVQTKSALVTRDIDILKKFKNCEVGMTITTTDDAVRKAFEPGASPIEERFGALRQLHENGIRTYIFAGPILPYLEGSMEELVGRAKELGVGHVWFDRLNLRQGVWLKALTALESSGRAELVPEWKAIFIEKTKDFYGPFKEEMARLCREHGVEYWFCY